MTSFSGDLGINIYRAHVIASGLRLYAKTGMKPNRAYTPSAMLRAAEELTGRKFKRGQYEEAAQALTDLAREQTPKAKELGQIS